MTISAGIIVWRNNNGKIEFFVGTPGGPLWGNKECWNFPKGQMEDGETPFQTAHREFFEETSVNLTENETEYKYYGLVKQRKDKSVHVFIKKWNDEKLDEECHSNMFEWEDGKYYPEIGAYKWMTSEEIHSRGGVRAYINVFKDIENEMIDIC